MRLPVLALLVASLSGCVSTGGPAAFVEPAPGLVFGNAFGLAASEPTRLTVQGPGFEPSIDASPDGTLYAAAAKTRRPQEGGRAASWTWYSMDGGASWSDLPSPSGRHRLMPGFEGDTAVDALGRFYFADTWLVDDSIHRWSPTASGPRWDWSRPFAATSGPMDDRPFLAAQGDGIVYLLSNAGPVPVAGGTLFGDPPSSKWLYVSEDGGETWSIGYGFGQTGFCQVAASPADVRSVWVACDERNGEAADLFVLESRNRGATWHEVFRARRELGTGYLTPAMTVDRAGTPYVAWLDERVEWSGVQDVAWTGDAPGRLHYATPGRDDAWRAVEVTPAKGRFGMLHAAAGEAGLLGITVYVTSDLAPSSSSEWFANAVVVRGADGGSPDAAASRILAEAAEKGPIPPRDLFQCSFAPDGVLHVVPQRNRDAEPYQPGDGVAADVFHVAVKIQGPD